MPGRRNTLQRPPVYNCLPNTLATGNAAIPTSRRFLLSVLGGLYTQYMTASQGDGPRRMLAVVTVRESLCVRALVHQCPQVHHGRSSVGSHSIQKHEPQRV